jgi:hypothetical protein
VLAELRDLSNADKWWVDHVNKPGLTEAERLYRAYQWVKARLVDVQKTRPGDADGFRCQLVHALAPFAVAVEGNHPDPEFRMSPLPLLPGGGWRPKPGTSTQLP